MASAMKSLERRKAPRVPVENIAYIRFKEDNGGIILNASEGGLCCRSITPLQQTGIIRFWFSEHGQQIEGAGRLIWTDETESRGGLCFANMSVRARKTIYHSLTQPAIAHVTATTDQKLRKQNTNVINSPRLVSDSVVQDRLFRGFSGGLFTGILTTAVVAGAFIYRQQTGKLLIRLGEHLASTQALQTAPPVAHPTEKKSSASIATGAGRPRELSHGVGFTKIQRTQTANRRTQETRQPAPAPFAKSPALPSIRTRILPHQGNSDPAVPVPLVVPSGSGTTFSVPPSLSLQGKLSVPSLPVPKFGRAADYTESMNGSDTHIERSPGHNAGASEMYFEIGKFKEYSPASNQTNKLANLGFPTTILHKGHLWMNSYRVLVGPYYATAETQAAHRNLAIRGFHPRAFERGFRKFVLPPQLTLNGASTPNGDCEITWESYLPNVKVSFEQKDHPLVRASGRWMQRDPKYEQDATVYRRNRDGSRSLIELRFEGMNRALVFEN